MVFNLIDIIIPAYNAHKTIVQTLFSIANQEISNLCNVYIINDGSDFNYNEIVKKFEKILNIKELALKKNSGPGYARQYGIDQTCSDYIVFIDADDVFYNYFSLKKMYDFIKNSNYDAVFFAFLEECKNGFVEHNDDDVWLHGKIYRRSYLSQKNIRFNSTYSNEDNSFNKLFILSEPKIKYVNECVYIWKYCETSITRKNNYEYIFKGLDGYIYNMIWTIEEAQKRNYDSSNIAKMIYFSMIEMYYFYLQFNDKCLLSKFKNLVNYYDLYKVYLKEEDKNEIIRKHTFKLLNDSNKIKYIIPDYSFTQFISSIKEGK